MKRVEIESSEAWDLGRVRRGVESIASGSDVTIAVGGAKRQVVNHLQAARVLGWLTRENDSHELSELGEKLLATKIGSHQEFELMRDAVENSRIVAEVATSLFDGADVKTVTQQLLESPETGLSLTTARKRANTLCKWREQVTQTTLLSVKELVHRNTCSRVLVVHLSDIHFSVERENPVASRMGKIVAATAARLGEFTGMDAILIVISGDIASTGCVDEYEEANTALEILDQEIKRRLKLEPVFFLAPGNHDLNFKTATSVRTTLLENVDPNRIDSDYVLECTKPQEAFRAFAERWHNATERQVSSLMACEIHTLSIGGKEIVIQLFNTAWMSSISERQGGLVFPAETLKDMEKHPGISDLVLSVFHHPYNWLEANNARKFRGVIERTSDVVLTGHEHVAGNYSKKRSSGEYNEYMEGGVLQETAAENSEFNLLILDLEEDQQNAISMKWDGKLYGVRESYPPAPFQRNQYRLRHQFRLTDAFLEMLTDPGEPYAHPRKSPLTLEDLFLYPEVQETEIHKPGNERDSRVFNALDFVLEKEQVLILGGDYSGKTALSKRLFFDLHRRGVVPILLDSRLVATSNPKDVHAVIQNAFTDAFGSNLGEQYLQLEKEQRAIIVDDFHRGTLDLESKDKLVKILCEFAASVVLLAGDELEYQAFTGLPGSASLWEFSHARILEFGHLRRYELVKKWCYLGNSHGSDEIAREVIRKDSALTGIISSNFAPSVPGVLILSLQSLELNARFESDAGSYGHLYEALLVHNLHSSGGAIALDAKQTFLAKFAFFLFSEKVGSVDEDEFGRLFEDYKEEFHVSFSLRIISDELFASKLIVERQGRIKFRYQGAYYFFSAFYLAKDSASAVNREEIRAMAEHVHTEEASSILLFLCHINKGDRFILDLLLEMARGKFIDVDGSDFGMALKPLGKARELPILELNGDVELNRQKDRKHRDDIERSEHRDDVVGAEHREELDGESIPTEIVQFTASFKIVRLLGQILRGFPGSIDGQRKTEIATECYALSTRATHAVLSSIVKERVALAELLSDVILVRRPGLSRNQKRLNTIAQKLLFGMCEGICVGALVQVSSAVGSQDLSRTYAEVIKTNDCVNYKLIDLAIQLEHFKKFPRTRVECLNRDFRDSLLPKNLLRQLVYRHLHIFSVDYRMRSWICDKLEIKLTQKLPE